MRLGESLIGQGLATLAQIEAGLARQQREGGHLGANLVAMGVLTVPQLLVALKSKREAEAAIELCQRALTRLQSQYGEAHPMTGRARYSLARVLLAAGRPADAAQHVDDALADHTAALGRDHEWTRDTAELAAHVRRAIAASTPAAR
jgi:hypothetical protein